MKKLYNNKVLETFLILQPILDIVTAFMKNIFSLPVSVGMIIRFAFLVYSGLYIFEHRNKKINIYIGIWFIYLIISIVGNYIVKDNFNIFLHIADLMHMIYLPIITLFYYVYFKNHKLLDSKVFTYIGLIIGTSLIVSILTDTSYCTYPAYASCYDKGYLGWFNSGNEYGIILTILLGYLLIKYIKINTINNFIGVTFIILFLSILGTKTSFMGLMITLISFMIYEVYRSIKKKQYNNLKYVGCIFIIFLVITLNVKKTPIYYNMEQIYKITVEEVKKENPDAVVDIEPTITSIFKHQEVSSSIVYNGRDDYVVANKDMYKKSKLFNKLFGMTKQGNYYNGQPMNNINERDFHDLYMYYGVFGLILEMLLPLSMFVVFIKNIIKKFNKAILSDEIVLLSITTALCLLISYMAGHLVFQPAVVIYFAYTINVLVKKSRRIS